MRVQTPQFSRRLGLGGAILLAAGLVGGFISVFYSRPVNKGLQQTIYMRRTKERREVDNPKFTTEFDGTIMVPERRRDALYLMPGNERKGRNNSSKWPANNSVWSMELYPSHLWTSWNSINDVKRVIHKDRTHIAVCGNGGRAVALYDFATKKSAYWSRTCGRSPHDVEYIPLRGGYLALASSEGKYSTIELHDANMPNNSECISGSTIEHSGVHSVHWDSKQRRLWAWGSATRGLVEYKVVFKGEFFQPHLVETTSYFPDIKDFKVGTGHGASPMIKDGRRYLILAAADGILRFDTESHKWKVFEYRQRHELWFSNPKGLDYNQDTEEIIITKSISRIFLSKENEEMQFDDGDADIYKARWWQHNAFSYGGENHGSENFKSNGGSMKDERSEVEHSEVDYYNFEWYELPPNVKAAAKVLGYSDEEVWRQGEAEESNFLWDELTSAQREAGRDLGYQKMTWNERFDRSDKGKDGNGVVYGRSDDGNAGNVDYYNFEWFELPPNAKAAAKVLGYFDEEVWCRGNAEESYFLWDELTSVQREAARQLGYKKMTWDDSFS